MATKKYLDDTGLGHFWDGVKPKINEKAKITLTGVDPGEGSPLNAGEYVAVYGTPDYSALLDLFYPVGSYYETSDTSFNPNTAWGGTWVEDTAGRVLVAKDTGTFATVGDTGGAETHVHALNGTGAMAEVILKGDGRILYKEVQASGGNWTANYKVQASSPGSLSESNQGWGAELKGNSQSASSLPPYIVIRRWHRIA